MTRQGTEPGTAPEVRLPPESAAERVHTAAAVRLRSLREKASRTALGLPPNSRQPFPTQTEIAALLGISPRWFRDLERLNSDPWPTHLADAYAQLLGISGRDRLAFYSDTGCLPGPHGRGRVSAADRLHLDWTVRDPAYISDSGWDVRYRNHALARIVPKLVPGRNMMLFCLKDPDGRQVCPDFDEWAYPMLNQLRRAQIDAHERTVRAQLDRVVEDLLEVPEVREIWENQPSIARSPNGDVRTIRPADPGDPEVLGPPTPVRLYVSGLLGRPEDEYDYTNWRIMHITVLDEVDQASVRTAGDDYEFWFNDSAAPTPAG